MIKRYLHITIAFILFTTATGTERCMAAGNGIALTLVNYSVQNSQGNVDLGQNLVINATITNNDSLPFAGVLNFGLHNSSQVITNGDIFRKPPYINGSAIELAPYESVPAIFTVHVTSPYFLPGPDVVVVWPISNKPKGDSIVITLQVNAATAIKEEKEPAFSYLILNDKILLFNIAAESPIQQVRIFNTMGQLLITNNSGSVTEIPLTTLPRGIYLCEFISADNKRKVVKFAH